MALPSLLCSQCPQPFMSFLTLAGSGTFIFLKYVLSPSVFQDNLSNFFHVPFSSYPSCLSLSDCDCCVQCVWSCKYKMSSAHSVELCTFCRLSSICANMQDMISCLCQWVDTLPWLTGTFISPVTINCVLQKCLSCHLVRLSLTLSVGMLHLYFLF